MPGMIPASRSAPELPHISQMQIHAASATKRKPVSKSAVIDLQKARKDDFIMDTNNSSIVSKRSVEKLYYAGQPEYFRPFVTKFKRRSPLINRGYWLRMKAIEFTVTRFLSEQTTKRKLVVNLGCGYDPLPFMFIGGHADMMQNAVFVDVDYPQLMRHKLNTMDDAEQLRALLSKYKRGTNDASVLATSDSYVAIGCDLNDINATKAILDLHLRISEPDVATLFIGEVSLTYMSKSASQAVIQWAATLEDVRFCLLEQHLPDGRDHPFAETMLTHFQKINTPLNAISTIEDMHARFVDAGWPDAGMDIRTLWELWSDPTFLTADQRRQLDQVEPFDEWEEFALFGSHYYLLVGKKKSDCDYINRNHRASVVGTSRASLIPSPSGSVSPSRLSGTSIEPLAEYPLVAPSIPGNMVHRRFAAIVAPESQQDQGRAFGLLAGIGYQGRRNDCDTYTRDNADITIPGPSLRTGVSCFTVTNLDMSSRCLMVGGRTSPDQPTAECWLRQDGQWARTQNLPEARFRHNAVAVSVKSDTHTTDAVLVFGGKTNGGTVLNQWLLWTGASWRALQVTGETPPPRFGAAMITDVHGGVSGVLTGGMTSAGRVLGDMWHWNLTTDMHIQCRNVTSRALGVLKTNSDILGRFGAQLVRSNSGILLIGGVSGGRMLTRHTEILNMRTLRTCPIIGRRPMFVGCSILSVDGIPIVLGGGATCFSFGTYWNQPSMLTDPSSPSNPERWKLLTTSSAEAGAQTTSKVPESVISVPTNHGWVSPQSHSSLEIQPNAFREMAKVESASLANAFDFGRCLSASMPIILKDGDIGPCLTKWNADYLKQSVGCDRKVVVHHSQTTGMDFRSKNFEYTTMPFGDFIDRIHRGEKLYLRALSKDAPSDRPTNLADDFPEIAADFELPGELLYVVENLHSSPLRISGPVNMWLHYDVMANVLCQVHGRKRLILFPPSDVGSLGFAPGASSSSIDVFNPTANHMLALASTHPLEAVLEPGDILFIPPMWMHTAAPTDGISIAVNIFFRTFDAHSYAAGRDVYGNRDLAAYDRGRRDLARIVKSLESVPADISGFYLERLAKELSDQAKTVSRSANPHTHYAELS